MTPQRIVGTVKNNGRVHTRTSKAHHSDAVPLDSQISYAAFSQLHARSKQLVLPTEYTQLAERLEQQAEQLATLLDQETEPSRKRTITHCIGNMHDVRSTLPNAVENFVQARIDALNPLGNRNNNAKAYEKVAKDRLHDALVNAKWRLPTAERAGPTTSHIVKAISNAVDTLVQESLQEMGAARTEGQTR